MSIVDIIIIVILLLGAIVGYMRGFLPQLASLIGFILTTIGAFILKNPLSQFLYEKLPFFNFSGVLKGVTIINILLYEVIAFVLAVAVLYTIYTMILKASKLFQKSADEVGVVKIISGILGAVLGVIENYVVVIITLYILSLPFFNFALLKESKFRKPILKETPVLSGYVVKTTQAGEELWDLIEVYQTGTDANSFNLDALDVLLKYNITTVKSIDGLVEDGKLTINNIDRVLTKYRKQTVEDINGTN